MIGQQARTSLTRNDVTEKQISTCSIAADCQCSANHKSLSLLEACAAPATPRSSLVIFYESNNFIYALWFDLFSLKAKDSNVHLEEKS